MCRDGFACRVYALSMFSFEHNNNEYFIDWTDDQLAPLEEDVRPSRTLDAAEASIISKTERLLNTKLAWAWVSGTCAMMYDRTQYVR